MVIYLRSLPPVVAAYADEVLKQDLDQATRERLIRLVTEHDMDDVWQTLSKFKVDNPFVFREFARIATVSPHLAPRKRLNHGPSPAIERRVFQNVARLLRKISQELSKLNETQSHPAAGLNRLLRALHRAELDAAKKQDGFALQILASVRRYLADVNRKTGLIKVLGMLLSAFDAAAHAPPPPGPRKKGEINAARTAYIQELSSFVRHHFKKPLHQIVASTTNVAFGKYNNSVTPDLVRKLTAPFRKVSSKKTRKRSATS